MIKKIKNYMVALLVTLVLLIVTVMLNYTTLKTCVYTLCIFLLILYATRYKKKITLYCNEIMDEIYNIQWSKFSATLKMSSFVLCIVLLFCITIQCVDMLTTLLIKKIY